MDVGPPAATGLKKGARKNQTARRGAKPINWLSEKLKHVEIHVNFFRQYVQAGHIKLAKIASAENPADALTKSYATRASFQAAIAHFMRELPFRFRPTTQSSG